MKKLLFAIFAVCLMGSVYAQSFIPSGFNAKRAKISANDNILTSKKQSNTFGTRALNTFDLDYYTADALYADNLGFDFFYSPWEINKFYKAGPPSDTSGNFTCKWAGVIYDTLYDYETEVGYPLAGSDITVDSVNVIYSHVNTTGNFDTITFQILALGNGLQSSNGGLTLNNTVLWDSIIITNTSLTPTLGTFPFDLFSVPVGVNIPSGQGFVLFVTFAGDTANKFSMADYFRDECAGDCGAAESIIANNSIRWFNLYIPSRNLNLSGPDGVVLDCNANGQIETEACELYYFQNWGTWVKITANIPLSASVAQANLAGCPGTPVALSVNAVGGTAPYTYTWSNAQSGATVQVNVGNTVETYTVTVVDGNNDTVTKTVTVTPRGINVSLGNDQTVGCGQTVNLSPTVSGTVQGATYLWSTNATTLNITNVAPGTYTITANNSFGCSSTDNIVVSITGVNQSLGSNIPNTWIRNCPLEITNQSSTLTNWNFTWDFGDGNLSLQANPTHTWASLATFTVTLTADSSGCELVKTFDIEIKNGNCNIGIDEALLSSINIYPNPTTGRFVVSLDAVAGKNAVINVVNIRGEVVSTEKFIATGNDAKEINLSNVANGLYLVNIQVDGKLASKTILKN